MGNGVITMGLAGWLAIPFFIMWIIAIIAPLLGTPYSELNWFKVSMFFGIWAILFCIDMNEN